MVSHRFRQAQQRSGPRTLVPKARSPRLVEIDRQVLNPDNLHTSGHALDCAGEIIKETHIVSERGGEPDIRHDSDHHVLLEIELAGVKAPRVPEGGEPPGRQDRFQEFAGREGKQLSDICPDRDTWLANAEELVDKRSVKQSIGKRCAKDAERLVEFDVPGSNEDRSDEPSTESTRRHHGIVMVINHSTDLGIWGVLAKRR